MCVPYCVYYFIIAQKWSRTPDQHDKVGNYTCIKIQNTLFQGVPNKLPFWNFGRTDPYDTLGPFKTSGLSGPMFSRWSKLVAQLVQNSSKNICICSKEIYVIFLGHPVHTIGLYSFWKEETKIRLWVLILKWELLRQ